MSTPVVSVVIPAYNHGAYLTQTINSALAQIWYDREIIVVDDGSQDNTPEVATSFGSAIRFVRQENKGMAGSRNTGIDAARGEFVAFLDDDDLWEPEYLAHVVPALQQDPAAGACRTGFQIMDGVGTRLPQETVLEIAPDRMYDRLIDGGFFPPCTVTVRKAAFEKLGVFDTNLQGFADWDMWLRISKDYRYLSLPETLVLYRVHGGGLSSNVEHMFTDHLKAVRKHFGPEEGDPASWPTNRRRAYAGAYLSAALAYYQKGDLPMGDRQLIKAFQAYPPLAKRVDVFYELALADQPRGFRGRIESENLAERAALLYAKVEMLNASGGAEMAGLRSTAAANANLVLGMLADQSGDWPLARRYLLQAVRANPNLLTNPSFARRLAKVTAGKQIVGLARKPSG